MLTASAGGAATAGGFVYCVSNGAKSTLLKIGHTQSKDPLKYLKRSYAKSRRFTTDELVVHRVDAVCDSKLAERMIFHRLDWARVEKPHELFECSLAEVDAAFEDTFRFLEHASRTQKTHAKEQHRPPRGCCFRMCFDFHVFG